MNTTILVFLTLYVVAFLLIHHAVTTGEDS